MSKLKKDMRPHRVTYSEISLRRSCGTVLPRFPRGIFALVFPAKRKRGEEKRTSLIACFKSSLQLHVNLSTLSKIPEAKLKCIYVFKVECLYFKPKTSCLQNITSPTAVLDLSSLAASAASKLLRTFVC